jgi:hypothetical protein
MSLISCILGSSSWPFRISCSRVGSTSIVIPSVWATNPRLSHSNSSYNSPCIWLTLVAFTLCPQSNLPSTDSLHSILPMCHTLKYLILGCECLLQCVHLSIGFSENFKDFSRNYSIYPRARSILFYLESSKILFHEVQIFYLDSSCPKITSWVFLEIFRILPDIFFMVWNNCLDFSRFILNLKMCSGKYFYFDSHQSQTEPYLVVHPFNLVSPNL